MADKEGRLEDRPLKIKGEILRYREGIDINGYLTDLQRLGFIRRYSVAGKNYIQVVNFTKHQNPHHTEKASEIPEEIIKIDEQIKTEVKQPLNTGDTPADSGFRIPDPLIPEECTEPPAPVPFVSLILNDKSEYPIFEDQIAEWCGLYPAADVRQELRNMRGWCIANPKKRKTKSGILRFVTSWLADKQNKGGTNGQTHHAPKPNAFDRSKEKLREWERQQSAPVVVDGQVVGPDD